MSDDECDLDALVSLLDDESNSGDARQLEVSSGKSLDKGGGSCPLHRTMDTGSPQQSDQNNEECEMEDLTAFLEEEDDFEEDVSQEKSPQMKDSPCKKSSVSDERRESSHHNPCNEEEEEEEEEEDSDIQAELMNIQKKMLELQSQLKKRKKSKKKTEKSKSSNVSETGQHQQMLGQKPNNKRTGAQNPQGAGVENSNISAPKCIAKHSPSKKEKHEEKPTSVHKTMSPKSGTKSTVLNGEKEMVANGLEENPFFAKFDPQDEEEGTRGLFGDSDSDWEDLDGESKAGLSESGQVLKDLMKKGDPQRVSRASPGDVQELRQRALKSNSWKNRPFPGQEMVNPAQRDAIETYKSLTDPFSGIRIINPKISSAEMKFKMADRTLVKISKIHLKLKSADLQGNWVTIGVVVHKSEPRTSAAGKSFCVWRLSDLDDCDRTISFFLFGEVFKQHWKNEVKSVVGILNPNKMDKADKGQQDMAFTVNHPNQVLVMGHSQDLGRCAGVSKAGKACTNFINKEQGQFCVYHVQSAYKKSSAKRSELQGGSSVTPKNRVFGQRKNTESLFFYGGETFTNTRRKTSQKDQVTVRNLQAKQLQSKGKFTTMSLHNLDPKDQEKLQHLEQKKSDLVDLLATPTVGSLNFVKHLVKKENPKESESTGEKKMEVVSVSPAELLKQHKQDMLRKQRARQGAPPPQDVTPRLGRGNIRDGFVSLDMAKKAKPISNTELAKLMAISKLKKSGGIKKDDPNALKRKRESPESKQKIQERVLSSLKNQVDENKKQDEPPMKRSKLLGNIDENSEEFKKLMKSSSQHRGVLAEVEREQEERYFMELEKKEKYEDKMQSTMSVKCTVFTCKNCSYTAMKLADKCKTEGHIITKSQASKRFFKCKHCGKRKISIQKYPTEPCDCGEYNFQRTAMLEERKGPKLPSESLSLRGDEVSYLGAMNQRVYLNI